MISVIIPSYNYGHLINDTIDSVLNQSYNDVEIIIVDDGSTDNTAQVVAKRIANNHNITYIKQENAGPSAARNNGIKHCTGNFIQFLDADDLIEKDKFKIELQIFKENHEADVVYGSVRYFIGDPFDINARLLTYWGKNEEWMPKLSGKGHQILSAAVKGNFSHISSLLFRKSIIDEVGLFDSKMRMAEDYQYLLQCALANAYFYYHDNPGTYSLVRWHGNNASKHAHIMKDEERKMREQLTPLLLKHPEAFQNNNNAIKSLKYQTSSSWKRHFLSGGKFDFIKKIIRALGLEKMLLKLFYK